MYRNGILATNPSRLRAHRRTTTNHRPIHRSDGGAAHSRDGATPERPPTTPRGPESLVLLQLPNPRVDANMLEAKLQHYVAMLSGHGRWRRMESGEQFEVAPMVDPTRRSYVWTPSTTLLLTVTPLVLQELKFGHDIICMDISLCLLHLECIH
jgi:hypothetical protein